MTDEEIREIRTKALKDDLASINNRLCHAFNQGFELGIKSITQKKKTGYWIDDADEIDAKFGKHTYKCSKCGKHAEYFVSGTEVWWDRIKPNFCPNCGIRMIEPQKSEEQK